MLIKNLKEAEDYLDYLAQYIPAMFEEFTIKVKTTEKETKLNIQFSSGHRDFSPHLVNLPIKVGDYEEEVARAHDSASWANTPIEKDYDSLTTLQEVENYIKEVLSPMIDFPIRTLQFDPESNEIELQNDYDSSFLLLPTSEEAVREEVVLLDVLAFQLESEADNE